MFGQLPKEHLRHRLAVSRVHVDEPAGRFALPGEWPSSSRQITIETCGHFFVAHSAEFHTMAGVVNRHVLFVAIFPLPHENVRHVVVRRIELLQAAGDNRDSTIDALAASAAVPAGFRLEQALVRAGAGESR